MLRHPKGNGRSDQGIGSLADAAGDRLGADRIGADQPDRSMLLGRADRQDHGAARPQIGLDFRPTQQLQLHKRCLAR